MNDPHGVTSLEEWMCALRESSTLCGPENSPKVDVMYINLLLRVADKPRQVTTVRQSQTQRATEEDLLDEETAEDALKELPFGWDLNFKLYFLPPTLRKVGDN